MNLENLVVGQEILYRRCSRSEAEYITNYGVLPIGHAETVINNISAKSDPNKWITHNHNYATTYQPKGVPLENYQYCAVLFTVPGTLFALRLEKTEGNLAPGPRKGYGIPPELLPWFNNRILSTEIYDVTRDNIPIFEEQSSMRFLLAEESCYATFMAFSPSYIKDRSFNETILRGRMSWLKTSLLWTLWRSDWMKKEGMERLIQVNVPMEYFSHLMESAISTKQLRNLEFEPPVVYQEDPDRRIIGRRFKYGEPHFVKAGTTIHFGLRGRELGTFIDVMAYKQIQDITDIVLSVADSLPEHPTSTLYQILGLSTVDVQRRID